MSINLIVFIYLREIIKTPATKAMQNFLGALKNRNECKILLEGKRLASNNYTAWLLSLVSIV